MIYMCIYLHMHIYIYTAHASSQLFLTKVLASQRLLGASSSFSLLRMEILTGRKHQIRSHLSHCGHLTVAWLSDVNSGQLHAGSCKGLWENTWGMLPPYIYIYIHIYIHTYTYIHPRLGVPPEGLSCYQLFRFI